MISFSGAAAGDEAGAAIRLLDLDADGVSDLVIGAPGGDGPANGRSNAGNVYAFFGPITAGAHSVNEAQAVFYGAAANYRAGERIATGDINRDTPNDLVILSPGGSSGSGELDIYYGRARASIGHAIAAPGRSWTSPSVGQVSRRIFGDPAAGAIAMRRCTKSPAKGRVTSSSASRRPTAGAGRLYFTISPRLQVSRTTRNTGRQQRQQRDLQHRDRRHQSVGRDHRLAGDIERALAVGQSVGRLGSAVVPRRVLCRRTDEHALGRHLYRHAERDRHESRPDDDGSHRRDLDGDGARICDRHAGERRDRIERAAR